MAETRWETLRDAAAVLGSGTHGFDAAEDEVAFSELAGGLLEALAVQFAVRRLGVDENRAAEIVATLNDAAFAFASRAARADVTASCDCYHDNVHDFSGCRQQDLVSGDFCYCRCVTGVVDRDNPDAVAELVRDQYDARAQAEAEAAYEAGERIAAEIADLQQQLLRAR